MSDWVELRDGSVTLDPRLDRIKHQDSRSRHYAVAAAVPTDIRPSRSWAVDERLDQGYEGACVGFGVTHELAAYPKATPDLDYAFAMAIYNEAKRIDPWPGEDYEGTAVLAGAKAAQARGYFDEYRWCFSVEDMLRALSNEGPVVVGTNWTDSMYDPSPAGLVDPSGEVIGGHCFLIRGYQLRPDEHLRAEGVTEAVFRFRNSWGPGWGRNGDGFITVSDYEKYLLPEGDQVVFMGRHKRPATEPLGTPVTEPHHWHG